MDRNQGVRGPYDRLQLTSHHALVCGASRGIGRATARLIAARGASVTLLARSAAALELLRDELVTAAKAGSMTSEAEFRVLAADLSDSSQLGFALDIIVADAHAPDILINNTGGPPPGLLLEAAQSQIVAAFQQHVLAAHALVGRLLPGMRQRGYGRIINVLSTSVREPIVNLGVSNMTRAAMASWAKTLSRELPPGVTINNVLPGSTDTERLTSLMQALAERTGRTPEQVRAAWLAEIPEGRLADPSETAEAIAFLASPAGGYIRGHSLPVDGGRLKSL